jgi:hypothetical protein
MVFAAVDPGYVAVAVALLGPLGAYLVAARQMSGKIKNSEASELWAESRSIRDWSSARIKECHEHIDELEKRIDELEEENRKLRDELLNKYRRTDA